MLCFVTAKIGFYMVCVIIEHATPLHSLAPLFVLLVLKIERLLVVDAFYSQNNAFVHRD
jgi:hypothetical protein